MEETTKQRNANAGHNPVIATDDRVIMRQAITTIVSPRALPWMTPLHVSSN